MTNTAIARKLGTYTDKVGRWRRRYADEGIEKERPRGGNHGGRCPKAQAALSEMLRGRGMFTTVGRGEGK